MSNHQVEHCFGWMRFNPTWNREIDIIDNLVAENERLREEKENYRQALWIANDDKRLIFVENERLRGLLRETEQELSHAPQTDRLRGIRGRVREALGE